MKINILSPSTKIYFTDRIDLFTDHYMHALASVRIMNSEANCVQPLLP